MARARTTTRAQAASSSSVSAKRSRKPAVDSDKKRNKPKAQIQRDRASPGATVTNPLSQKKISAWSQYSASSPFPDFPHPTTEECETAHRIMDELHGETVRQNFADDENGPMKDGVYTNVMDALIVAAVSQATSWSNAKRAMASMAEVYGSTFAYQAIIDRGMDELVGALRPGGMQNRKAKILMGLLQDVKSRHGGWDLQYLFNASDEDVMKEVVSHWGLGPKCAHCLMSICLKRTRFAVDTHIYRLSGIWGWRPEDAGVEKTQAHLDCRIPHEIKFMLHYQMIVHGRACAPCRGAKGSCEFLKRAKMARSGTGEADNQK